MKNQAVNEEALKEGLRQGNKAALREIYALYQHRIVAWVQQNKGTKAEAQDLFQDALTSIYLQLRQPEFTIKQNLYVYLFVVCRNLWFNNLRKQKHVSFQDADQHTQLAAEEAPNPNDLELQEQLYRRMFARLGKTCQEILRLAIKGLSPQQIADAMQLKNEHQARNRKSYCKQQLVKLVRTSPQYKNLST